MLNLYISPSLNYGGQSRVCISAKWTRRHLLFDVFLFEYNSFFSHWTKNKKEQQHHRSSIVYIFALDTKNGARHCTNDVCLVPFLFLFAFFAPVSLLLSKIIRFGILFIISLPASIVLCPFALYSCISEQMILVWDITFYSA